MANTDSTPHENHYSSRLDLLDSLNQTTHKIEFLQDMLTLQPDGMLPENMSTTGLYYIMQDAVSTLQKVYSSLDAEEIPDSPINKSSESEKINVKLNLVADVVNSEFETLYLSLEGLLAVSQHSQINDDHINGVMNCMSKAKDSIRGVVDEACKF